MSIKRRVNKPGQESCSSSVSEDLKRNQAWSDEPDEILERCSVNSQEKQQTWLDDPGQDDVDTLDHIQNHTHHFQNRDFSGQSNTSGMRLEADYNFYKPPPPDDCLGKFERALRSIWRTHLTEDTSGNQDLYAKTKLRELIIYLLFIIVLCILTFGMTSSTMYFFTKVMKDLFVSKQNFNDFTSMFEFWNYAENGLVNGLYWEKYYNEKPVQENEKGYIYFENKLLGLPRLRQIRVRNDSCIVHKHFRQEIKECYAPYSTDAEEKRPFGNIHVPAWQYSSASELSSRSFLGKITSYDGGGYVQLLGKTKNQTKQIIQSLKDELWLDRGSRAIFIDFSVYNANVNLFCIVTLVLEFPATGGVIPFSKFRTLKLLRYVTTMDHVVMACEAIFVLFLLYYIIEEIIEIKKHRLQYFTDVWNVFDIIVVCMGSIAAVFSIYRYFEVQKLLEGLLHNEDQYANFDQLGFWQELYNDFVAVAVFVAWIKIFKYINFNKTMTQLQNTLRRCAKDIAGFAIMFFIVFLAYAQWGYLIFGTQVQDFSTYLNSIFTLFRIILGDFDFRAIEDANRVLGPIFFVTYVFFVFFVLINMFLAIINDTYAEVKSDLASEENEFAIGEYLKKGYGNMMKKLTFKREKIVNIQQAILDADTNHDSQLHYEEWRLELKERGHADAEIDAVFAKYDIDGDRVLNEEEVVKMKEDLEDQKAELKEEMREVALASRLASRISIRDGINNDNDSDGDENDDNDDGQVSDVVEELKQMQLQENAVISRRMDRLEHSFGNMVSKMEAILTKLEHMEDAKQKRRNTIVKLLGSLSENDAASKKERLKQVVIEELDEYKNIEGENNIVKKRSPTLNKQK